MEVEVVEVDDNGVNSLIGMDMGHMALPRGPVEDNSDLAMDNSVETADVGDDWVSLFFDESYLNAMTMNPEVDVLQSSAHLSDGNKPLSHSTMILSSSPGTADCAAASFHANVNDRYPEKSHAAIVSLADHECLPPHRHTGSPDSSLTQASGESCSGVQPSWWGNEDPEEEGNLNPGNGSEEESSTSNFDSAIPGASGLPVLNKAPIEVQEVKFVAEPASSVGRISTGVRGNVERSDRKRRSWEREEVNNGQQQSCVQSDNDRKGNDSGDGAIGEEDDEKRQARLMRNRESAQLSRQRKKVYVDELEGRLRTMAATIAELNATINHLTAENVNLRRQLGFFYQPARPTGGMPMMQYPGLVSARPVYPGAPMPPVPIPRLKPQQSLTKTPKRAKSSKEPGEKRKAKKVASIATVGVMGLLCITMLLGPFDWGSNTVSSGPTHIHVGSAQIRVGGRVLTSWDEGNDNVRNTTRGEPWADGGGKLGDVSDAGDPAGRNVIGGKPRAKTERRPGALLRRNVTVGSEKVWQSCSECYNRRGDQQAAHKLGGKVLDANVSEQVSLFVPRNNKLVKVDGNLIIRAVMAGDKAAKDSEREEPSSEEEEKGNGQIKQDVSKSSSSPPTLADHQLIKAISSQAQEGGGIVVGERQSTSVGAIVENKDRQRPTYKSDALASVSATPTFSQLVLGSLSALKKGKTTVEAILKEIYEISSENQKAFQAIETTLHGCNKPTTLPMVGRLQQWVLDVYHPGPVLSTGMCTEVFRFDTSPAGSAPNTGTPRNSSPVGEDQGNSVAREKTRSPDNSSSQKKRDPYAVPLPPIRRKDRNGTEPVMEKVFKEQEPQSERTGPSTMVVSVFTGPQDVGGEDSRNGAGASKGLSQIFVVVLVDSVKYITYSCMLPPTGSQVHVVST